MTPVAPLVQPPVEDLRNAQAVARVFTALTFGEAHGAFADVDRLIGAALEKLGEPHPVTVEVAQSCYLAIIARGICFPRDARDTAAAITRTALTWELPK